MVIIFFFIYNATFLCALKTECHYVIILTVYNCNSRTNIKSSLRLIFLIVPLVKVGANASANALLIILGGIYTYSTQPGGVGGG